MNIGVAVILDFTKKYRWEWYAYVHPAINGIMISFIKYRKMSSMFRNYTLVQNMRLMHDMELFAKRIGLLLICVYPADVVREPIS